MKFITLLRGINVGGNNKVAMAELKECFESLGFEKVVTYINSGNVLFESTQHDKAVLVMLCEAAIEKKFGFRVVCSVIFAAELQAAVRNAPAWWGIGDESSHNALFAIAPVTARDIAESIGELNGTYEQVAICEPVLFWSASRQMMSRTRYRKIVGTDAYKSVTIRNANTTKRLVQLCDV